MPGSFQRRKAFSRPPLVLALSLACLIFAPASALASNTFLGMLHTVSSLGTTVPENGDQNPYGIVTVPRSAGSLVRGDIIISNFNNEENLQGTGTTIVQKSPWGGLSLFAEIDPKDLPGACPGGVGLTTGLAILPDNYVVVGSLPSENGEAATASEGCLIVLNPYGEPVATISGSLINGPWDLTAARGPRGLTALFVSNVLNGTVGHTTTPADEGTVVRIDLSTPPAPPESPPGHPPMPLAPAPTVVSEQVVATGFPEVTNKTTFVVGPTGVGLSPQGVLYVADTFDNRIVAVPSATTRTTAALEGNPVSSGGHLNAPLGLTVERDGNILTTNGGDGNIVETAPGGSQLATAETEAGEGGLFGLALTLDGRAVYFVDDGNNTLGLLH